MQSSSLLSLFFSKSGGYWRGDGSIAWEKSTEDTTQPDERKNFCLCDRCLEVGYSVFCVAWDLKWTWASSLTKEIDIVCKESTLSNLNITPAFLTTFKTSLVWSICWLVNARKWLYLQGVQGQTSTWLSTIWRTLHAERWLGHSSNRMAYERNGVIHDERCMLIFHGRRVRFNLSIATICAESWKCLLLSK